MNRQFWIILLIVCLAAIMLLCNKKVCLIRVFIKQLQVFKNAQNGKTSIWDIICFVFLPVMISILIVFGIPYQVDNRLSEILTTVFALVFTILFGFAAVIVEKSASDSKVKKRVISETFISIITSTVLSLIAAVISIILTIIDEDCMISMFSAILIALSLHILMLLLMITKRTFVIYCEGE